MGFGDRTSLNTGGAGDNENLSLSTELPKAMPPLPLAFCLVLSSLFSVPKRLSLLDGFLPISSSPWRSQPAISFP